ncbi:MAG: hypothetical protein QOF60_2200 [Actinomycetota bacterium]|jgi:hypothetical protein|nr:hypothetical protein [Actinomycetota bacterium]
MEKARPDDVSGEVSAVLSEIDVTALVAHTPRLGADELDALLGDDWHIIDALESEARRSTVSTALTRAMLTVDDQLRPLVGDEAWALYVRRCELGTAAESVTGTEQLTLGLVLGAAWQHRTILTALHEWLIGGPLSDPGRYAPVDHQAAMAAAYQVANQEHERLLEQLG